eukprot:COSAG03_NODE_4551_length_1511_cov_7.096894_3_plen_87_part_00
MVHSFERCLFCGFLLFMLCLSVFISCGMRILRLVGAHLPRQLHQARFVSRMGGRRSSMLPVLVQVAFCIVSHDDRQLLIVRARVIV